MLQDSLVWMTIKVLEKRVINFSAFGNVEDVGLWIIVTVLAFRNVEDVGLWIIVTVSAFGNIEDVGLKIIIVRVGFQMH
jgi:hypothetical protein